MGQQSTKENKNIYQQLRENCKLTREAAAEKLDMSTDRLVRLENESAKNIYTDEIVKMSEAYGEPALCNYYCTEECAIGKKYTPKVDIKDLSKIVLQMLSSLGNIEEQQKRLIDMSIDDCIDDKELADFVKITKELEKISVTADALMFWAEKKISEGKINKDLYEKLKNAD